MVRDDEPQPERDPAPRIPDEQRPDADELAIERELLRLPGVQAATLAGDRWLVYLRSGVDRDELPDRVGDRVVEAVMLDT